MFKFYVGVGLNYLIFMKKGFNIVLGRVFVDNDFVGVVV